jgi:hypothetical protein
MKNKDFVAMILSHGRPNNVYTYKTLRNYGYTGDIIIVVDNEDKTIDEYKKNFDNVVVFNKQKIANETDQGDNLNDLRTTTHARNAMFKIAKYYGYKYFIQLDDDYTNFRYRFFQNKYITKGSAKNLDKYFLILLNFYKSINAKSIAMAQGGDFIGGESCGMISSYERLSRKCMNSFICSVDRPFKFVSRLNEDVNTYLTLGARGDLFLTLPYIGLEQKSTQATSGGMTDTYLDNGTYQKSFFSVMYSPSFCKISLMGVSNKRLHHSIDWNSAVPKIISEDYKK